MEIPRPRRIQYFTPLRYPGGKTFLFEFFDQVIKCNGLRHVQYIEPFAGGAGAALALLLLEKVDRIVINDLDHSIYCFWKAILVETDRFIEKIESTPITIDVWKQQRDIFRDSTSSLFDRGFAAFFLNRTNHSGILNGGPIGGIKQEGPYGLAARFTKADLIKKIRLIALYRDRIKVLNLDGPVAISRYANARNSLQYIDPPYYVRGSSLYLNSYRHDDHARLARLLNSLHSTNWILSYDNVEAIKALYFERDTSFDFTLHYQARESRQGSEVIVLSDTLKLPAPMSKVR